MGFDGQSGDAFQNKRNPRPEEFQTRFVESSERRIKKRCGRGDSSYFSDLFLWDRISSALSFLFQPSPTGFYRVLSIGSGCYWVLPGFTMFFIGFNRIYRVLPKEFGFYRVFLCFTVFHQVKLGFIKFYRVLPGFTMFH